MKNEIKATFTVSCTKNKGKSSNKVKDCGDYQP
jgi:hypothetical protein